MKIPRGRFSISTVAIIIFALAFAALVFTEDLWAFAGSSISKLKTCSKKDTLTNSSKEDMQKVAAIKDEDEDKISFDPEECNIEKGMWVYNTSAELYYTDVSCPYLDKQVACSMNGRPDSDYLNWEWQLDECFLPRFNATALLEKLRGKRLMFVGDSLQRQQWQSLVCMVESHIPTEKKLMNRSRSLSVFKMELQDYNATIEFNWAPFLIESNSDDPIITDTTKRVLRVDSIANHAKYWVGVDILIFNSYVWWMNGHRIKSLWGSFGNGEEGYEELEAVVAYRLAMKSWANWVDSNLNQSSTRVFFTTASPTHMRSADWKREKGLRCYNETRPVTKRGHWGSGSDKRMMEVVSSIVQKMKVPVTFINITQLSEYRKEAHASVYTKPLEEALSENQEGKPQRHVDCIHWCLPGVPDTWNQIFYAYL
ncbi:hypothetical protein AXF42_Ash011129 [Apostasia shenzhenica]|uniref:Uncharacterized protein n=1 Tax=Apostasia shenzhenica TaxID=1088818 RepID=A0A2I0AKW9_9ASPA|nr:hypothetical protein AXF42_Ash011129 [Apostasia shenzhenica]